MTCDKCSGAGQYSVRGEYQQCDKCKGRGVILSSADKIAESLEGINVSFASIAQSLRILTDTH